MSARCIRVVGLVAALVAISSCYTPRTEIILLIETDMTQGPTGVLTGINVEVDSQDGTPQLNEPITLGVGSMPQTLPATLGITPRGNDATRHVTIVVTAVGAGGNLFTYRAIVPFANQHTTVLDVFLANRCREEAAQAMCTATQSCGLDGCDDDMRNQLPDYDGGTLPDASPADGANSDIGPSDGGCADTSVTCNAQCTTLATDVHNCGRCGNDCAALPGVDPAHTTCSMGACVIQCLAADGDCDHDASNGCESPLTSAQNCGTCGTMCHAGMLCGMNSGRYGCASSCTAPTPDQCGTSCVDLMTDPNHCGNCGTTCSLPVDGTATCSASTCGITCNAGYHACSGSCVSNQTTATCGTSCTACGSAANATTTCDGTTCGFTCAAGFADCNHDATDGCEVALSDPANCGACSVACTGSTPLCTPSGASYACSATCTGGAACAPANPCELGTIDCPTGTAPTCDPNAPQPAGSPCPGGVCDGHGTCNPCTAGTTCSTGNSCETGITTCSSGSSTCVHYTYLSPGSACVMGSVHGVCDGAGTCTACTAGLACTSPIVCENYAISCSSGAPVCTFQSWATPGTPCGPGTCTAGGSCSICTSGLTCDTGNPCTTGITTCADAGVSMCSFAGNVAAGTPCPGGVCDGAGTCTTCAPGAPCGSTCAPETIVCTSGAAVCQPGTDPMGTPCGPGGYVCDGLGRCVPPCMPGVPCGTTSNPCIILVTTCRDGASSCDGMLGEAGNPCGAGGTCSASGTCNIGPDGG